MTVIRVDSAGLLSLWEHLLPGRIFDDDALAKQCATDGGYDFSGVGLTNSDIKAVFSESGFTGETSDLAFFCSEILAYYRANVTDVSSIQVVCFALNAALAWRLSRMGHLDWEMKVDDIFCVLCRLRNEECRETLLRVVNCIFDEGSHRLRNPDRLD